VHQVELAVGGPLFPPMPDILARLAKLDYPLVHVPVGHIESPVRGEREAQLDPAHRAGDGRRLGGGPIGSELTQCFARLGAKVTQVEMLPRIMIREDPEFSELVMKRFREEGVDVLVGHKAKEVRVENGEKVLIVEHEGTLERFAGDGLMVFFNDPVPVPDPAARAVRLSLAAQERAAALTAKWRRLGIDLGLGIGVAQGYATIGAIGFEGRWDYGAIGTVTNLAARLCGEARPGQILVSRRLYGAVDTLIEAEAVGELSLKGFAKPVTAFNVLRARATG